MRPTGWIARRPRAPQRIEGSQLPQGHAKQGADNRVPVQCHNTSAAKVDADSPLVQSAEFVDGKPVKLRIPDKIAAAKELTKMCGWAQPNRIELSARDTLAEFITSIREAPRRPGMAAYAEGNGERG